MVRNGTSMSFSALKHIDAGLLNVGYAEAPVITVPTITLEGDANGAPHPGPSSYAQKFSGKYEHGPSRAASVTTCRRRRRRPSRKRSSTSREADQSRLTDRSPTMASFSTSAMRAIKLRFSRDIGRASNLKFG